MWYDGSQNDEYIYSHPSPNNSGYVYTQTTTHIQVVSHLPPSANTITYTAEQLGLTTTTKIHILTR